MAAEIRMNSPYNPNIVACTHCGKTDVKLQACVQCHFAKYCGQTCQSADGPRHVQICQTKKVYVSIDENIAKDFSRADIDYLELEDRFFSLGNDKEVIEYYEKTLKVAQHRGDRESKKNAYGNLGNAYYSLGECRKAVEYYEMAVKISQEMGDRAGEEKAYGHLGIVYASLGEYQTAIKFYEKALKIAQDRGDRESEGNVYECFGNVYHSLEEYLKAIEYHEKALKIFQEIGDQEGEESTYKNLELAYDALGEYEKAIEYHEKALKIVQEIKNRREQGNAYGNLGLAHDRAGEYRKAIEYYKNALKVAQEAGDRKSEGNTYGNLGIAHRSLGEYRQAVEYYSKALNIAKGIRDREGEGAAYLNLGNVYHFLGEYRKAIKYREKALEVAKEIGDRDGEGVAYGNLGNTYRSLGEYRKAIECYEKALKIAQDIGDQRGEENTYGNLGNTYYSLGGYQKAVEYYEKALKIAQGLGDRKGEEAAYGNLGNVYHDLEEYQKAIECYGKSSKIAQEIEDRAGEGLAYGNLGNVYHSLGEYQKAIEYEEKALKIAQKIEAQRSMGEIYGNIGNVYRSLGEYRRAVEYYKKALEVAKEIGDRDGEGGAYGNLGVTFRHLKELNNAENNFTKSIEVFSDLQAKLEDSHQWKISIFELQYKPYAGLETVLLEQSKYMEALEVSDSRRSRALVSILIKKLNLEQEHLSSPIFLKFQEIQQLAHKLNTTFITYSFDLQDEKKVNIWIIPSKGDTVYQSLFLETLPADMKDVDKISQSFPYKVVQPTRLKSGEERLTFAESFDKQLSQWYEAFILPIESYLPKNPKQTLTIIPDGFLSQIPFAALRDRGGKYLIEKYPISIAPSIKTLQLLDQLPKISTDTSLVVGNPTTPDPKDNRLTTLGVQRVVSLLNTSLANVLTQEAPTPSRVIKEMVGSRWIHLSCHGKLYENPLQKLDAHSIFDGYLKLAKDERRSGTNESDEVAGKREQMDTTRAAGMMGRREPSQLTWDKTAIARNLWRDASCIVSDDTHGKVVRAHAYLSHMGLELKGIKADGNCFLNAFLESLKSLSRRIPLLDREEDKVQFLRDHIASQYEGSPNHARYPHRSGQIRREGEWIAASEEGDLLAIALSTPIRVLTASTDGVSDTLTFPDPSRPRQSWDTISNPSEIGEYVFVVDLGGHFVYASKPVPSVRHVDETVRTPDRQVMSDISAESQHLELNPRRSNGYLHSQEIASLRLDADLVFMNACFSGRGRLQREGTIGPVWSFLAAGARSTVGTYWGLLDTELTVEMVEIFYKHLLGRGAEKLNKAQALQQAMLYDIKKEKKDPRQWAVFFLSGLSD